MKYIFFRSVTLLLSSMILGCQENPTSSTNKNNNSYIATHNLSEIVGEYLDRKIASGEDQRSASSPAQEFAFCVYEELGSDVKASTIKIYLWAICGGQYSNEPNLPPFSLSGPVALILEQQGTSPKIASYYMPEGYSEPRFKEEFPDSIREKISKI